jgi:hypothetical protein
MERGQECPRHTKRFGVSDAPRNYYDAVPGLQRAELFKDQESQDDSGSFGAEKVLQPVPQAYRA